MIDPTGSHQFSLAYHPGPESKVHEAYMGPLWGRQDPGGSHVGPMNLTIRGAFQQNVIHALSIIIHIPNKVQDRLAYRVSLSGEPDYFGRNKISSGGDLSHYSSASLY